MRTNSRQLAVVLCCTFLVLGWLKCFDNGAVSVKQGLAAEPQQADTTKDAAQTKDDAAASGDQAQRRRLPNYYARIGLSESQRKQVYGIQEKYRPQFEELERKRSELREKQNTEIAKVLTEEQSKTLTRLREEARQRRASGQGRRTGSRQGSQP